MYGDVGVLWPAQRLGNRGHHPRAVDEGVNIIATAEMVGPFINEELLGTAIKDRRHQVTLATKLGIMRTTELLARGINDAPTSPKPGAMPVNAVSRLPKGAARAIPRFS